jgi:hypothetical protein
MGLDRGNRCVIEGDSCSASQWCMNRLMVPVVEPREISQIKAAPQVVMRSIMAADNLGAERDSVPKLRVANHERTRHGGRRRLPG